MPPVIYGRRDELRSGGLKERKSDNGRRETKTELGQLF